jgi:choice-of-anchor B domain-containing protein
MAVVCTIAAGSGACGSGDPTDPSAAPPAAAGPAEARENMVLLAHLDLATLASVVHASHDEVVEVEGAVSGAGNWGYTSPDGRRFALTGTSAGLSIVEVTDPRRPVNLGLVPGAASPWREVKTYGSYAYVATEARSGMDIVDLAVPEHPHKVRTWNRTFSSAHTLWVDAERGLLFANGTAGPEDQGSGGAGQNGMRVLQLEPDPEDPREVGAFQDFYVHDAYSRGDLMFASAIYDGFLAVLDVSDPGRIRELTRFSTGGRFTHNSWPTRDGRYLFTTDERPGRPLEGWDLLDLRAPRKVSEYIGSPGTIPHNVMVDGDRLLVAHYTEGVHLLDVSDPERPRVMGRYDTYTGASTGFNGSWGAYIFPGSDLIVASDINGGLFVIQYVGPPAAAARARW